MGENQDEPTLKIGQLARRLGLNVRTLRYYESIGLLLPPPGRRGREHDIGKLSGGGAVEIVGAAGNGMEVEDRHRQGEADE